MIRYYESNSIMHRVLLGPDENLSENSPNLNLVTAILVSEGQDYWFDHVEIFNTDDDAFGIGNYSDKAAINVSVTHYKVYSASKGLLVAQDQAEGQEAERVGRVTIAWSDFGAKCRNFRVSGGQVVHGFNNYAHDFGNDTCGTVAGHGSAANRDGRMTPILLSESSVFDDNNNGLAGLLQGPSELLGLPVQGYVFTDGQNEFLGNGTTNNFVFGPEDNNNRGLEHPEMPYSYRKIPTQDVRGYVISNAGVDGENIVTPTE